MRGIVRCEVLHALAEVWKQECEYYNINLLGRPLTAILPIMGKQRSHDGQARCPSWADFVLSDRIINCCPSTIGWGHNDITEWQMGLWCFICDPSALGYNLTFPKGSNRLLCLWLQPPLVLPRRGDAGYSVSVIDWRCSLLRFCHRLVMQFTPNTDDHWWSSCKIMDNPLVIR